MFVVSIAHKFVTRCSYITEVATYALSWYQICTLTGRLMDYYNCTIAYTVGLQCYHIKG